MNIFRTIQYIFEAKKMKENPENFLRELSFAPLETFFYLSFFILGVLTGGFAYLAYVKESDISLIFSVLLGLVLIFDLYVFFLIKRAIRTVVKRVFSFSHKKREAILPDENIIDVEVEVG